MKVLPAGDRAVLVELSSLAEVHRLHRAVLEAGIAVDVIPGWTTLLVTTEGDAGALAAAIDAIDLAGPEPHPSVPAEHRVPVVYDGEDLPWVAAQTGLDRDQVVALHAGATFTVAFLGFSRGFAYLSGVPEPLRFPRRATPRTRVPAGSVAIAHDWCGIYPATSPGGWHLLGRTDTVLFDPARMPPTPLSPGDLVRFVPS